MAERVGQFLGNYQLLRLLGQGSFAEVYLAEHRYLEVPAAIKVLHVRMEPDTHEQFRREARTIAHLQHPHIIRVLDFGFQDQTPFLVMEYTPNGTLRTRYPKGVSLSLEQIIRYVKQIASALDYAHQQRVIHRDVKPENILLSANDEVMLSDFGIAVIQQSLDSLSTRSQAGTPIYMAPEQIQRKPCAASDQYAVGVLVYEWLCGEPPFRGSLFEVLSQHLHELPPSLCERLPDLPQAVEDAVFGALAKDPQARFVSVQDFAEALENACIATPARSLQVPSKGLSGKQIPQPGGSPDSIPVSLSTEQDRSSSPKQTLELVGKHTEDSKERVGVQVLSSAPQPPAWSGQEKVPLSRRNRQRLLRKVRAYWIAGVLEHSLHGAALLALGLQEQPDAIANPWQLVLQHPTDTPRPLPAGTQITEVYDAAEEELLILGAPGSGKTTLLLELACELLSRAEHDEQHPLPVVFNLSSWANQHQPLADWLVEELTSTYQVPRKIGQAWVDADQVLPLLDGLDEVAPKDRTACIEAINTYRQEHGLLPLVVCSRSADYLAQRARLQLSSAVAVQPLTPQQVDDYLASGGEPLWALRVALHRDVALRELTSSPLMLSILTLTYHGMPVEELLRRDSLTDLHRHIFEHYVKRMLKRQGAEIRYTSEQTMYWLTFLARQLKQQNQTEFYLENMQQDWLPENWSRSLYGHMVGGLTVGVVTGLSMGLAVGLGVGLVFGLAFGLVAGLILGLITLLLYMLPGRPSGGLETGIKPVEVVVWSWLSIEESMGKYLVAGLPFGLVTWLIVGLLFGVLNGPVIGLLLGLGAGLYVELLIVLVGVLLGGGLSSQMLEEHNRVKPNQGIRRSARNSMFVGLAVGIAIGLISGLLFGILAGPAIGLSIGLLTGFLGSLWGGLWGGGDAWIKHVTLRLLLWRTGYVPWNYPRFLDFAAEHNLLCKVGGGYIFVHRLLLEYFASLNNSPIREQASAHKQQVLPGS
jgi:serine/threonine protein kinase